MKIISKIKCNEKTFIHKSLKVFYCYFQLHSNIIYFIYCYLYVHLITYNNKTGFNLFKTYKKDCKRENY